MEEHDERLRRVDWAGALIRSLRRHGVRRLEIDLTDVHRAGTDTVAALVLLQKAGSEGGVEVTLRCSEEVERWIEICRLADLLCDDASE
jgi:anti-anti-sigma regulatory factor